jgi:hypothetical protein
MAGDMLDYADPVRAKRTEIVRDANGLLVVRIRQQTAAIVEANKQAQTSFDPTHHRRARAGFVRVASIPNVVVMQLCDAGIWDDPKALAKWLDQPENRFFRTDDGRRLA